MKNFPDFFQWLTRKGKTGINRREVLRGGAAGVFFSLLAAGSVLPAAAASPASSANEKNSAPSNSNSAALQRRRLNKSSKNSRNIKPSFDYWQRNPQPPGRPHDHFNPIHAPGGWTLPFEIEDGIKIFHLVAEPIQASPLKDFTVHAWGYNGGTPGPVIEAVQGDRVRIYVTNNLPAPTTVHWHAIILPNGQDGVSGITQPPIPPGRTGVYDFIFPDAGTFMYHPHFDDMTQIAMGMSGMIVVHPRSPQKPRPDRDFAIMLSEWAVPGGTSRINPLEMTDFNILTMNGRSFPDTKPLVAQVGDRVRIRLGNLSPMEHHPIHLHGYSFRITETDGGPIPENAQWPETTVLVPVGSTRTIELVADNPGDWFLHCHMTHHTMNQMSHGLPNMIGVNTDGLDEKMTKLLPGYMTMGTTGMGEMGEMKMPTPPNSAGMRTMIGQFGDTVMGGMATLLKVRDVADGYDDPGPYDFTGKPQSQLVEKDAPVPKISRHKDGAES